MARRRPVVHHRDPPPTHRSPILHTTGPDTGQPCAWTTAIVRAILRNPKYLGRQVWGCPHHEKRTPRTEWVWSDLWVHQPLVTAEEFAAADRRSWHGPSSDRGHRRLGESTAARPAAGRVMAANHYPDGLTIEAIIALQWEVTDELRREGYPVQPAPPAFVTVLPVPARSSGLTTRHHEPTARRGGHCRPEMALPGAPAVQRRTRAPSPRRDRARTTNQHPTPKC